MRSSAKRQKWKKELNRNLGAAEHNTDEKSATELQLPTGASRSTCEPEDRSLKSIQSQKPKEKRIQRDEESPQDL